MTTSQDIAAFILAGGKSSRFGSDKARALIEHQPLIVRQAKVLESFGMKVTVVAEIANKYADLGLPTMADEQSGLGPMGGLATVLDHIKPDQWALVSSCDVVELKYEWIKKLLEAKTQEARVVAFHDQRWQPFPALYRGNVKKEAMEQIAKGQLALWRLMEKVGAVRAELPAGWTGTVGANTPDQC